MKTFYITIDIGDCTSRGHINEAQARTFAKKCDWSSCTPFRVDITQDGKPHFEFTELEEPKPDYWAECTVGYEETSLHPLGCFDAKRHAAVTKFVNVYRKDDQGNLILLNDEEKAKVIEEWKNS